MDQPLIGMALGNFALLGSIGDIVHWIPPILAAAVALGLVIFVHELGHFAVAKMCGVKCEKFFLGFDIGGRKIWSFQWGETEYGIGILPLGGYVKMLGQDDNPTNAAAERERAKAKPDAAQSTASVASATAQPATSPHSAPSAHSGDIPQEPTAENHETYDPRSYIAKNVPQRMAIISAGVIMNLIFAVIFATIAYRCGVSYTPCIVGEATPGDPAWVQGVRPGDKIIQFGNDKPSENLRFDNDLLMGVLFTGVNNDLKLVIERPTASLASAGSKKVDVTVRPSDAHKEEQDGRAVIGVRAALSNRLAVLRDSTKPPAVPGSPAEKAKPPFAGGDLIVGAEIDGVGHPIENGAQILALLAQHPDQPIKFTVSRDVSDDPTAEPKKLDITVAPAPLRDLGIVMQMGPIAAVQDGSPADAAGMRAGDRIKSVDGRAVDDPMLLPDEMRKLAGKEIPVEVSRTEAGQEKTVALRVTPRLPIIYDRAPSSGEFGCDALGIAYPVLNTVSSVRPDASSEAKEIQPGDKLVSVQFVPTEEQKKRFDADGLKFPSEPIEFNDKHLLWPELQTILQSCPTEVKLQLAFKRGDKDVSATVNPIEVPGEFYPDRGLLLEQVSQIRKADSWPEAFHLGLRETKESIFQIVMTVRKLASGGVSPTGLAGPGTIVAVAAASASQGIPKLLIFLTFLSANLAVINFLPIPILDGGHMMFLLYEGIRGKPASERVQMYLTYLGLVFILTLMVFVIGLDITRLVKWVMSLF